MSDGRKPLSTMLKDLCDDAREETTIGDIVHSFGRRAFGALLFVFSVPNLLPLPPGSSTVLGAPLVLLAPQVALGVTAPWLPRAVRTRRVKTSDLRRVFARFLPMLERIERLSRPRLFFLFGPVGDRLIGIICTVLALVLILPIPFGNLVPAFTIGTLALALFQRDGMIALIGYACAATSAAILVLTAGAVMAALRQLEGWVGL